MSLVFIVLILIMVFGVAGFARPLCRALGDALAFVRDPSHRVLPVDPWEMFTGQLGRRLRWWVWVWGAAALGLSVLIGFLPHLFSSDRKFIYLFFLFCTMLSVVLGIGLLIFIVAFDSAPRMSVGAATILSALTGTAGYLGMYILWAMAGEWLIRAGGFPQWIVKWTYREVSSSPAGGGAAFVQSFTLHHFYMLGLLALGAWWTWRRAKKSGEKWFRFEG